MLLTCDGSCWKMEWYCYLWDGYAFTKVGMGWGKAGGYGERCLYIGLICIYFNATKLYMGLQENKIKMKSFRSYVIMLVSHLHLPDPFPH